MDAAGQEGMQRFNLLSVPNEDAGERTVQPMTEPVVMSWCRHCGSLDRMTREHIPPASTGNTEPVRRVDDPFDLEAVSREVVEWQEGHVVRTLCSECNHRASRWKYVSEYRRWHDLAMEAATERQKTHGGNPLRGLSPLDLELPHDVHPARFVRQVVGMLMAIQEPEHLFAGHPQLADLIGGEVDNPEKRREAGGGLGGLHLYLSVSPLRWAYFVAPALVVRMSTKPRISAGAASSDLYLLVVGGVDPPSWTRVGVSQAAREAA